MLTVEDKNAHRIAQWNYWKDDLLRLGCAVTLILWDLGVSDRRDSRTKIRRGEAGEDGA